MFSSNANLATIFPPPSTDGKRSLVSTHNGITKLTSSALSLSASLLITPSATVCLTYMITRGICHAMGTKDIITMPKKEIFTVLPYLGIQS